MARAADPTKPDPPTAPDAEHSLLGATLIDPSLIEEFALDRLEAEAFYSEKNRLVWRAITTLYWRDRPIDVTTVAECLRSEGTLETAGGMPYLVGLLEYDGIGLNAVQYHTDIQEAFEKRRLLHVLGNATRRVYTSTSSGDIRSTLEDDLLGLHTPDRNYLEEADVLAQAYIEGRGGSRLPTGFPSLDHQIGGLPKGDLTTLAGRLSMGKSALAHQLAFHTQNAHVLTPDQPLPEILMNEASRRSRVRAESLRRATATEEQRQAWRDAYQQVRREAEERVTFDPGALTLSRMRLEVRRAAKAGRDLIIIDTMQAIRDDRTHGDRRTLMIGITGALKDLAREHNVAIVALSQISRAVEERESRIPELSDLSESKTIEDDSNLVLLLYRKGYYFPNASDANLADLIVAKNKTGERLTRVQLLFDGPFIQFREPLR